MAALTGLLAPAVAEAGFDLEEVDVRPAGRRRLVRIVVDADGGVSLDDIARLSETASALLDGSDAMGSAAYVLEVTSPGVDRPLTEPRHWRRAAGRLVVAPLTAGGQVEGRVIAADDESVEFDVVTKAKGKGKGKGAGKGGADGDPAAGRRRFLLGELGRGRVQVEFRPLDGGTRGPAPGDAAATEAGEADETRSPAQPD
ncbi:ribosome maturation factor RimP [Spirillospora albida]|uniref:ribosome maturation factor RimP n=1 Tax=Spirillospora albida TaxID=58123 RepID=UPI00068F8DC0|nr:ribosome maturation factor RimP [Spirillospora albida]